MQSLDVKAIAPPYARYAHGVVSHPGARVLAISGQLGTSVDGVTPPGVEAQARICFANIEAILSEAGATKANLLRLNAYVTDRAHFAGYMAARDAWLQDTAHLPASTLMIVSGFTRPEFLVEVEALAAV